MAKDVIVALDFATAEETLKFLDNFKANGTFLRRRTSDSQRNKG